MASQTKTQHPTNQTARQHGLSDTKQEMRMQRMVIASHGQGQVRNPETDKRLKANRI